MAETTSPVVERAIRLENGEIHTVAFGVREDEHDADRNCWCGPTETVAGRVWRHERHAEVGPWLRRRRTAERPQDEGNGNG
jgi:hypothetical protein